MTVYRITREKLKQQRFKEHCCVSKNGTGSPDLTVLQPMMKNIMIKSDTKKS